MTTPIIKDRYGSKLSKKQLKPKPQYWRLLNMLKRLRLKYREQDVGTGNFHITVPDFGIAFKFNSTQAMAGYSDWDIVDVDLAQLEINDIQFGQDLMWLLVSKGYMAYLRDVERGNTKLHTHFIVVEGWGLRIIEKRLELYANKPCHKFMIEHNKNMRDRSIGWILHYYPDFFDYLW